MVENIAGTGSGWTLQMRATVCARLTVLTFDKANIFFVTVLALCFASALAWLKRKFILLLLIMLNGDN